MAKKKADNAILGSCGEHYIAAYLSGYGLIVAMPRGGMPGFDLFVTRWKASTTRSERCKDEPTATATKNT